MVLLFSYSRPLIEETEEPERAIKPNKEAWSFNVLLVVLHVDS
jgi:hypothetical protein